MTQSFVPPQVSLRAIRERVGMTLEQLAEAIREQGVETTKVTLSNAEIGRTRASERLIDAWSRALGLKPLHVRQEREIRSLIAAVDQDRAAAADLQKVAA